MAINNTQEDLTLKQDAFIGPVKPYQGPVEPTTAPLFPLTPFTKGTTTTTPQVQPTSTITSQTLTPQAEIPYTTPVDTPPYPTSAIPTPTIVPDLQATGQEQKESSLINELMGLNTNLVGEEAYRAEQEKAQGMEGLLKTQNELASRVTALKNEALAIPMQLQQESIGRGRTEGGLRPLQTAALRNNAIQALSASSLLEASRGNITLANELVDKAVNQKYGPMKAQQKALMDNLELVRNDPETSRQDKNRAQKQLELIKKRDAEIAQQEADETAVGNVASLAASYGADSNTLQKIQNSKNPAEAMYYASQAGFARDPFEKAKFEAELAQTKAQTALVNANIRKVNEDIRQSGLSTTISTPNANNFSGALGVILGSTKMTKDQKNSVINAINNGSDPVAVIKNQAKDIMGQTEATKVSGYETAKAQLTDIQSALKAYYAAGGKTSLLSGKYEQVVNKLGSVSDPKLVDLTVQIQSALQIYRNAVSGTAYSVQEGADIASIFPGITNTEGLNMARLEGRLKAFDSTIDGAYRTALGDSYDEIKNAENFSLSGEYNGIIIPGSGATTSGTSSGSFTFAGLPLNFGQ